jgi:hypothetical protein
MNRDKSMRRRWKKDEKKENYKNVFKTFFSTTIIEIIIIVIIIIIIFIIIKKNEYQNCVNYFEDFDILFIYFVEFFASVSSLKEEDWEKISKSEIEKCLCEKFVCVVYLFVKFSVSKNVHFDCEFCDSILILSLLFDFEFVASSIFFSILENLVSENQSLMSFFFVKKKKIKIKKEIVFIFVFLFAFLSIHRLRIYSSLLFSFLCWISRFRLFDRLLFWVQKSVNSLKKKKRFLDEKFVIKSDVSNLCERNNSSFSSLNKSCVEVIKIEKKRKEIFFFCFEFFVIDFLLNCRQNLQKEKLFLKKKKQCSSKSSINIKRVD